MFSMIYLCERVTSLSSYYRYECLISSDDLTARDAELTRAEQFEHHHRRRHQLRQQTQCISVAASVTWYVRRTFSSGQ